MTAEIHMKVNSGIGNEVSQKAIESIHPIWTPYKNQIQNTEIPKMVDFAINEPIFKETTLEEFYDEENDDLNAQRKNIRSFLNTLLPLAVAMAVGMMLANQSECEESDGRTFKKNETTGRVEGV